MSVAPWTAHDEGYLRAYKWADALAGGARLPQEATAIELGSGEVAHARFAPVGVTGYLGEDKEYRHSCAETGPLQISAGTGGVPAGQFQPAADPVLRLESPSAPLPNVFVHNPVDWRLVPCPCRPARSNKRRRRVGSGR